jgi:hypothetical protein
MGKRFINVDDKTQSTKSNSMKRIAGLVGVVCLLLLLKQDQSQKNPPTKAD